MTEENFNKEITTITVTCDSYLDLLPNFFTLYKKYSNLLQPLVIGENKTLEGYNIFTAGDKPWGERIFSALKKIKTKYILFTLEDYYFTTHVDKYIQESLRILKLKDFDKVALVSNSHFGGYKLGYTDIPNFYQMLPNCNNLATLQLGLWKKESFEKVLNPTYSPWDFEIKGKEVLVDGKCGILDPKKELVFNFARKGKYLSNGWQEFLQNENLKYNK